MYSLKHGDPRMTSFFQKIYAGLREDPLLQRVVRNSSYLFGSNTVSAALNVVQGIFVIRLLGSAGYGLLTIVMDFASNTNRLLSFRMSEVVVKYMGEALAQELAPQLFDSVFHKIGMLPRNTVLYPGHGAGTLCARSLKEEATSTLEHEFATNPALQIRDKEEFVQFMMSGQPRVPTNFSRMAKLNRAGAHLRPGEGVAEVGVEEVERVPVEPGRRALRVRDGRGCGHRRAGVGDSALRSAFRVLRFATSSLGAPPRTPARSLAGTPAPRSASSQARCARLARAPALDSGSAGFRSRGCPTPRSAPSPRSGVCSHAGTNSILAARRRGVRNPRTNLRDSGVEYLRA